MTSLEPQAVSQQNRGADARYYSENGYVVCSNLIPHGFIDRLLESYEKEIRPSNHPFYRQSSGKYEVNKRNEHGYVVQSFLDIHDYEKFKAFSERSLDLFTCPRLLSKLSEITGAQSFNLMQTMLFDANTATQPHQDWWYLDTVPNGHLIAAWIAMEDIDERAGRFYVLRDTTQVDLHSDTPNLPHLTWIRRVEEYLRGHPEKVVAPALKKGDVLFWNSRTIHGALPTQDPSFSRKSLTAHYIPSTMKFGNLFKVKDYIEYKEFRGVKFFKNQPDYTFWNHLKSEFKLKAYNSPRLLKFLRRFQGVLAK
ncbi:MAG: phytanoyl-CoA dioxygenase family protein [Bdellovibrionota bacterium]